MTVRSDKRPWVRKLDGDRHIVPEQPQLRLYPADLPQLQECVQMAMSPPLGGIPQARAIGSHWCISKAGVTPGFMIETATPLHETDGDQTASRLNRVLREVVPPCLSAEAKRFFEHQAVGPFNSAVKPGQELYLFHVEAGIRIHELYAFLDEDDAQRPGSLAEWIVRRRAEAPGEVTADYAGPWALETMGGAGGQTIAGVMSTATHGGDLKFSAIGEAVVAMHLIGPDGRQYWIERTRLRPTMLPGRLVDKDKLQECYGKIEVHRNDDLMNAAVVSCGRMGVVYSLVLRVMRPYALHEHRSKHLWNDVKQWLVDPTHPSFKAVFDPLAPNPPTHFVKIDVNPYGGFWHPSKHECYLVTRVLHELDWAGKPDPLGRLERGGANAGKGSPLGTGNGWFSNPCASDNWIRTGLMRMRVDFADIRDKAIKVWLLCGAVIVFPLTPPPVRAAALAAQGSAAATILAMQTLIGAIAAVVLAIGSHRITFGDTLAVAANTCAHLGLFPILRGIYEKVAESVHEFDPDHPSTPAISYAAMDEHDYLNVGCVAPGDSIEFFVDADSVQLPQFIEQVLGRVRDLEGGELSGGSAQAFGGYISLRFMTRSDALLAMQRWPRTCSIEIAGLSQVHGTESLLRTLEEDAKSFDIVLHWGQRNGWGMAEIEKWFGSTPSSPLYKWRQALSDLSEHGRWAQFSTDFSKHKGLEITDPRIGSFTVHPSEGCAHEWVYVAWDAMANPPETQAFLVHTRLADGSRTRISLPALAGTTAVAFGPGRSTLTLVLERYLNERLYVDSQELALRGFSSGDPWTFAFTAELRVVDGVQRWAVEINLYSQYISNMLRVSQVQATFAGVPQWRLRHKDMPDTVFTTSQNLRLLPALPVFNTNWLLFSEPAATASPGPAVTISFTMSCP